MRIVKQQIVAFLLLFSFINCNSGFAQNTDTIASNLVYDLSLQDLLDVKVKVSSTVPTDIFSTPSGVTVIDKKLIDQYNFNSVSEAVRQVAGVEILQTVIDKNVPTFRGILQNFYANKILVLINNVPVWQPTYGNTSLDRISINDVYRIEVLKGPASVLYGTNAYNGVINIILHEHKNDELIANLKAGQPNIMGAGVNFIQKNDKFSWNISVNSLLENRNPYLVKSGKDSLAVGNNTYLYQNDTAFLYAEQYKHSNINLDLKYKNHSLFLNSFINSYTHPGVNATYLTGANKPITENGSLLSYLYTKKLGNKTQLRFNTYFDYHYRNQRQSQAFDLSAEFSSSRLAADLKINHNFNEFVHVEFGGNIFEGNNIGHNIVANILDTIVQENIEYNSDIIEGSFFGQANISIKWFSVLAGTRYTYNKNFGSNISPRVTMLFNINKSNAVKLIYGQSFRTPNLLELYFDHWTVVGNPHLKPETNTSFEFIYLNHFKNLFSQITAYYSKYDNLIQRTRDGVAESDPAIHVNAPPFEGAGIEIELKYQNNKVLNGFINYNYMQGLGNVSESNFMYVPSQTMALGLSKPIKQFFISSNLYAYSATEGPISTIPNQYTFDAHLGLNQLTQKGIELTHTLSVKNIGDSDMLIPEYIRQRNGVNDLATTGYGRRIVYSLKFKF